jgi:hypothetical protein
MPADSTTIAGQSDADIGRLVADTRPTPSRVPTGRLDGRTKLARRTKQLERAFIAELGGDLSDARLAAVRRAADLLSIAEQVRSRWMAGDLGVSTTDIVRVEGTARRALIDLNLPLASGVRPAESLEQYLARTDSDGDDGQDGLDDAGIGGPANDAAEAS